MKSGKPPVPEPSHRQRCFLPAVRLTSWWWLFFCQQRRAVLLPDLDLELAPEHSKRVEIETRPRVRKQVYFQLSVAE